MSVILIIEIGGTAHVGKAAVIQHGEHVAGHFLPQLACEHTDLTGNVVGFERMSHRLMDQDSTPTILHDHVHLTCRAVCGLQHGDGFPGTGAGHFFGRELLEHLESHVFAQALPPHVAGVVSLSQGLHDEKHMGQRIV